MKDMKYTDEHDVNVQVRHHAQEGALITVATAERNGVLGVQVIVGNAVTGEYAYTSKPIIFGGAQ